VGIAFATVLVILVAYFGYVAYEGSRQLTDPPNPTADCRTPGLLGWPYESINYDADTDAALTAEADPLMCSSQGMPAGDAVIAGDANLAGWYVPAANGADPTAPTVLVAHGWRSNKSNMLERAAMLHPAYNLLLLDFRNHGQSADSDTTQGVREADDIVAMIDWLEANKGPSQVAILGVSMGGASALAAAEGDDRVDAVIVESTHATLAGAATARLANDGYPLSVPGSWAILLGTLVRTGEDVSAVDPVGSVARLDGRPVMVIHGALDTSIGADDAQELAAAAEAGGSSVELHVCETAGHADSFKVCPEAYQGWVLGFLERVLAPPA